MRHFLLVLFLLVPVLSSAETRQVAIYAGGCFWCVEKDLESVPGVIDVVSGFTGGDVANPTYKKSGAHLEAVEVTFDADRISYAELTDKFIRSIDPFDAGGQFCDRGRSYSPALFVSGPEQRQAAEKVVARYEAKLGREFAAPVLESSTFYPVGAYHQDYYKSEEKILTRFGLVTKARAYKKYRDACGRDARVRAVWGDLAFPKVK